MAINMGNDEEDLVVDINVTPLIDIMLVLLILFMVTSSLSLESGLNIDLPKASQTGDVEENKAVIVSLSKDGDMAVNGERVPFDQLGLKIKKELESLKTNLVILEGDQKATLGRAMEIMEISKKAGGEQFAIAAEEN